MKVVSESYLKSASGGAIVTKDHNNSEIYTLALSKLGQDVLLGSTVTNASRSDSNISLVVTTPSGPMLIQASHLLVSIPPLLTNLAPLDLDKSEVSLFSHWNSNSYYSMLINNTGLPYGYRFENVASNNSTYHIPATPAPYFVSETNVKGLWYAWYTSQIPLARTAVEQDVTEAIERLRNVVNSTWTLKPTFVSYKDDTPFAVSPDNSSLANGFYDKVKTVQGRRSTWYTGAAWVSYESPVLWNFTSTIVSRMLAEM